MEPITLTEGEDIYRGSSAAEEIFALAGDDLIVPGEGADTVQGGAGNDTIRGREGSDDLSGGEGDDQMTSGRGRDWLRGGQGDDNLFGGVGADTLRGGLGADTLEEGPDSDGRRDVFKYFSVDESSAAHGVDRVVLARDEDVVDLRRIDADATTVGVNDAFVWIGASAFSGTAGELRITPITVPGLAGSILQGDVDGDGEADLIIEFQTPAIDVGDIIL